MSETRNDLSLPTHGTSTHDLEHRVQQNDINAMQQKVNAQEKTLDCDIYCTLIQTHLQLSVTIEHHV